MYFTEQKIKKILKDLEIHCYPDSVRIESYKMKEGFDPGNERPDLDDSRWVEFRTSDRWGGRDTHYSFRTRISIPENFHGKTVVYRLETGREGQWDATNPQFFIYVNGRLIQGLDVNHREIELASPAVAGDTYTIALNAYSGMNEGLDELRSQIAVLDKDVEKLYWNIKVPLDVAALLESEDKRKINILKYLDYAVNLLDLRKPFSDNYYRSVLAANEYLEEEFYGKYCTEDEITAWCVGHTHIDVAWLWRLGQTREKAGRSFSTVLNLMEHYPEYIFMSSQPQLYQFVKEDYPEVYENICEKIREGRWEPEGAMWLEADCNLSSGESLVRQILFGTRFFEREFGVKNKILWLPDVFGYSAALPQILKKSGIEYFVTSKISWNEYNKMPYDTFLWVGLDGTAILTHFLTACSTNRKWLHSHSTTYNANLIPDEILGSWLRYQQKSLSNEVLVSYGYGDGGGGPTKEMLENARRLEKGIPGCPRVRLGKALDFLERLKENVLSDPKLPKWVGELYLEYHRGTYTSMARNKKFNRKSEFMLQDVEWLSSLTHVTGNAEYPAETINKCWETVLLNQFHDILPGSSIREVYEDSLVQYREILGQGQSLLESSIRKIAEKIDLPGPSVVVMNQLGFERSDIVTVDIPEYCLLEDQDGNNVPLQRTDDRKAIFYAENIPAKGYKTYSLKNVSCRPEPTYKPITRELENRFFALKFDDDYNIISLTDKRCGREIIGKGSRANVLQAFEDKPFNFDAWDINIYYQDKMWEINDVEGAELVEDGPVRTSLKIRRRFLDSVIYQTIILYNDIPRIDFKTEIDWKEKHILLKAAFPVDIHSDKAAYDIQFGNVERPTHWNTSWDYARFEVCAHKWADLSEDDYGVSLLNDCKYGYDIKDGVMRITLLKSATYPNEDADRETHEFTYSLYPHMGGWRSGNTVQMAYSLNCPLYGCVEEAHSGSLPSVLSLASGNRENVIIETIKKAEDSDDIIIRLYECYNRRTKVTLEFYKELSGVYECDLMESESKAVPVSGKTFEFEILPYEIKTFKLKIKA
jgi:alpha-mannosidase